MRLFFIIFFTLYGLVNFYFYWKLKNLFPLALKIKLFLLFFLSLMTFSPAIIRLSENHGYETLAIYLSWIGYLWMAFIVLFLFFGVFLDLLKFLDIKFLNSKKINFLIPLIISIFLVIYGYFEGQNIRVEKVSIKSDKILKNIKIVQISDVHIGLLIREKRVNEIVKKIKEISPHIVVSTGDLVDGQIDRLDKISEILDELNPPYGKFAITGNHEYYAGINQSLSFIQKSGFNILRNEGISISDLNLTIIGVDDPEVKRFDKNFSVSEKEILLRYKDKNFVLLLKHRPIIDPNSRGLFDLQLSGHTHKGQLFPFSIITGLYYSKQSGCVENYQNCYLYISRGTGTWGPPIRIFAKPEITIIEIRKD